MDLSRPRNSETPKAATFEASNLSETYEKPTMKSLAKTTANFTIFNFGDSTIRVTDKSGEPWFVAKDVCDVLGIANSRDGISRLDADEKDVALTDTLGGQQELAVVSESGMYTLVLRCRDAIKPGTVPHSFRKWVTAEVLPAVRKNGVYEKPLSNKKDHQSTATQLTPLRQTAERLITTGIGRIYPDIWKLVHKKFGVNHIHQLLPNQVFEAVEYLNAIEGEYISNKSRQLSLPISYPMSYFDPYRWMIGDKGLSSPWNYPEKMLVPNGDFPNPLGRLLFDLRNVGYEVDAAMFQLKALQHHIEALHSKIEKVSAALR